MERLAHTPLRVCAAATARCASPSARASQRAAKLGSAGNLPSSRSSQRLAAQHALQSLADIDAGLLQPGPALRVHAMTSFLYMCESSSSAEKKHSSSRGLKAPHSPFLIISSTRSRGKASLYTRLQLRAS